MFLLMVNKNSYYGLTFNLNIIYCQNQLLNLYKVLNFNSLKFESINKNINWIKNCMILTIDEVNLISQSIINSKIVFDLPEKDKKWLSNFNLKLKENNDLYKNKRLMFNYLILKLKSIGFPEDLAIKYVKNYYVFLENKSDIPDISIFINSINKIFNNKDYFICDFYDYETEEKEFFKPIFFDRLNCKDFDIKKYETDLIYFINESFIKKCYIHNSIRLNKKLNKEYSILIYGYILEKIFNSYNTNIDEIRFNKLIQSILSIVEQVINTW